MISIKQAEVIGVILWVIATGCAISSIFYISSPLLFSSLLIFPITIWLTYSLIVVNLVGKKIIK